MTRIQASEQRRRPRYLCNERFATVQVRTGAEDDPVPVVPIDFNCYGFAIFSPAPLPATEMFLVNLCYEAEEARVEIDCLLAHVIYARESDVGHIAGLAFETAQVEEEHTLSALALIENELAASHRPDDRYHLEETER